MVYSPLLNKYVWITVVTFALLLAWVIFQLTQIVRARHRVRSFHGLFLIVACLWVPSRIFVFFASEEDSTNWVEVFYLLPTSLQFAGFALWVIFFANVEQHNAYLCGVNRNYLVFGLVVSALFIVDVVVVGMTIAGKTAASRMIADNMQHAFSSFSYLILTTLLLAYAYRFSRLSSNQYNSSLLPRKPNILVALTLVLSTIFLAHAIYDLLFICEILDLTSFPPLHLQTCLFFLVLEASPMAISLSLMARIPSPAQARKFMIDGKLSNMPPLLAERYRNVRVGSMFDDMNEDVDDGSHKVSSTYVPPNMQLNGSKQRRLVALQYGVSAKLAMGNDTPSRHAIASQNQSINSHQGGNSASGQHANSESDSSYSSDNVFHGAHLASAPLDRDLDSHQFRTQSSLPHYEDSSHLSPRNSHAIYHHYTPGLKVGSLCSQGAYDDGPGDNYSYVQSHQYYIPATHQPFHSTLSPNLGTPYSSRHQSRATSDDMNHLRKQVISPVRVPSPTNFPDTDTSAVPPTFDSNDFDEQDVSFAQEAALAFLSFDEDE